MSYYSICKSAIPDKTVEEIAKVTTGAECGLLCAGVGAAAGALTIELGVIGGLAVGGLVGGICGAVCKIVLEDPTKKSTEYIKNEICDQVGDDLCTLFPNKNRCLPYSPAQSTPYYSCTTDSKKYAIYNDSDNRLNSCVHRCTGNCKEVT